MLKNTALVWFGNYLIIRLIQFAMIEFREVRSLGYFEEEYKHCEELKNANFYRHCHDAMVETWLLELCGCLDADV